MKRTWTMVAITTAVLGLAGIAQAEYCPPMDHEIQMAPTNDGEAVSAAGGVRCVLQASCTETLGVLVVTKLPDGTRLAVEATTAQGTFKVGSMTVFMGVAQLYLESDEDSSGVFPMENLYRITVTYPQSRLPGAPAPKLLEAAFVD